ncbi:hypothetical protein [Nocardia transvalensis]|uniref:hypothetical protein n=1 Tax=Nocardia transvalensis TaxID=37333 RepID=UPI001892FAFB|nr:hypothetical protein [Nocardia transvalensis]
MKMEDRQSGAEAVSGGRRRGVWRVGLLVAAVAAASTFGYGVVAAQESDEKATESFECNDVEITVTITEKNGTFKANADKVEVEDETDKCNVKDFSAETDDVSVEQEGDFCVVEAKRATGVAEEESDTEKTSNGRATVRIPTEEGEAAEFTLFAPVDNPDSAETDKASAEGTVEGLTMESCDEENIPTGTFTATGSYKFS